MSDIVEHEPYENMVRASVDADLGHLIFSCVPVEHRTLVEEAIVSHSHDMLEAGLVLKDGDLIDAEGRGYIKGIIDAIKIFTGEE